MVPSNFEKTDLSKNGFFFWRVNDSLRSGALQAFKLIFELGSAQNELKRSSSDKRWLDRGSTAAHKAASARASTSWVGLIMGSIQPVSGCWGGPPCKAKPEGGRSCDEVARSSLETRAGRATWKLFRGPPTSFDVSSWSRWNGRSLGCSVVPSPVGGSGWNCLGPVVNSGSLGFFD